MKIGLLEDNPAILDYMTYMFTMAGYEVYPYTESASLLQTLPAPLQANTQLPYDLLVIDILLPGELSGAETVIRLRQRFSPVQLPIIVVSACSQAELTWLATTIPGISTLRKPFKTSTLLQLVERAKVKQ